MRYKKKYISYHLGQKEWMLGFLHCITMYMDGFRVNNVKYFQEVRTQDIFRDAALDVMSEEAKKFPMLSLKVLKVFDFC